MNAAFVQARMASQRLPGKIMKPVMGRPLIAYLLERLSYAKSLDKVAVLTSTESTDDVLCEYLKSINVEFYRGSQNDVLDRFYQAALIWRPKNIVRVTADNPLVDPQMIDSMIKFFTEGSWDYVSTGWNKPVFPDGMGAEVFSFRALETAWKDSKDAYDREHVTSAIKKNPIFKRGDFFPDKDYSDLRWTVDYEEDFILVKRILEALYSSSRAFGLKDILAFKEESGDLFQINQKYKQKMRSA